MRTLFALYLITSVVFGGSYLDCVQESIEIERALEIARQHSGKPYKVWISRSKRTGECFWKVKGTEGYVILDAKTGEIIRFYRNRR
jgi:hypothetical protein